MGTKLGSKAIGSIVKLNVNGAATEFLIVHQGKPSSMYDDSCNGTWLLMKDCYTYMAWADNNSVYNVNNYESSNIHEYLSETFIQLFDSDIQYAIKWVKIPFEESSFGTHTIRSGANGLSVKAFLLSAYEVGYTNTQNQYVPVDGAKLDYFEYGGGTAAQNKRSNNSWWWLRSPYTNDNVRAFDVGSYGEVSYEGCTSNDGVRPAMILDPELSVSDDGTVSTNTAPTVTSTSGASGVNLGTKSAGFNLSYTVADEDGDSLTITEKLDGVTKKTFTSTGGTYTFDAVKTANYFKILNGTHTLAVDVNDGKDTVTFTATFAKAVHSATITLNEPLTVAGDITAAVLAVTGSISDDATYTVEVTNNANDTTPVWQNVTSEVKNGSNIVFANSICTNGAAFNFRISVSRGASGEGGHISAVSGAFQ